MLTVELKGSRRRVDRESKEVEVERWSATAGSAEAVLGGVPGFWTCDPGKWTSQRLKSSGYF